MTASPTEDLASAERSIQELTKELSQARGELAEAREQQAATAAILAAISNLPADPHRVFAEIAVSAAGLCDAYDATIMQVDGDVLRVVAHHGSLPHPIPESLGMPLLPLVRGAFNGRAVLDQQTIQVLDLQAETDEYPEGSELARRLGHRTVLAVPLIHAGTAIGSISVRRTEARSFTDRQVQLLKTFANQAVIAIEKTRLFEAEQASKRELQESLEQQTATADVLEVISRSAFDLKAVFQTVAQSSVRLCGADRAFIFRFDGELLRMVTAYNSSSEFADWVAQHPIRPGRHSGSARAALERRTIHISDVRADPDYTYGAKDAEAIRTVLGVPILKGDQLLGVMMIYRLEVRPFTNKQIALVETFADQAAIAIENARLFEAEQTRTKEVEAKSAELRESLEYQTATSEVLSVISRSPNDVRPVLDMIARIAQRLCQAEHAFVLQREEEGYRLVAANDALPDWVSAIKATPLLPDRGSLTGRVALEGRTVHVEDLRADPEYSLGPALQHGVRSELGVPLMRDGEVIGVIIVGRTEVRPFTDRQIALIETFADQAVIAIENTRLFEAEQASKRDLTEALEQQTATADVLKVISRSALDVTKVLDALVESAARLCDAYDAVIYQVFGDRLRLVGHHGQIPLTGPIGQHTVPLTPGLAATRAIIDRRTIQVADALAESGEYPESRQRALQLGFRTALAVPLVHAGEAIGVILIRRAEVRPFTERQIELVNTFADQAVIAIENTRLFDEVQARTRELAKTVEDLEIASQHKNQFVANMSHELRTPLAAVLGYAELIQEGFYEPQGPKSLDALTRIRSNGKHLLGLINTVLDIAKVESGQFTLNMSEYAIESVVETVRAATESLAQNKKLTLTTSVDKPLPVGLGDEQRLTQVLLNLVGNAIKFTDTGEVSIAASARNGNFSVSVTDTGPGIPLDQQDRIFEQFHQVDSSMTKAKGGTGLGLAIAKQIVEMHGGHIWVKSTLGKGATFQMELPTRAEPRKPTL